MITGEWLRSAREAQGKTQQDVADLVGVSLRTIGNWERTDSVPRKYWPTIEHHFGKAPAMTGPEARRAQRTGDLENYSVAELATALQTQAHEIERRMTELRVENQQLKRLVRGYISRDLRSPDAEADLSQADVTLAAYDDDELLAELEGHEEMP